MTIIFLDFRCLGPLLHIPLQYSNAQDIFCPLYADDIATLCVMTNGGFVISFLRDLQ